MSGGDIHDRVERERAAHTEDDVLKNAYALKATFSHTVTSKTMQRMHDDFRKYVTNVSGLRILDFGCGRGELSRDVLERGAGFVAGIDISSNYIQEALASAAAKGYGRERYDFLVMDAHKLTFENDSFDIVAGHGILHHLDLPVCLEEIRRVLRPGGVALFIEPLSANPFLKLFRMLTPRARTVDEKPLTSRDLRELEANWNVQSRYYGIFSAPAAVLTSVVLKPFPNNPILALTDLAERWVNKLRVAAPLNQYVMLVLVKPR